MWQERKVSPRIHYILICERKLRLYNLNTGGDASRLCDTIFYFIILSLFFYFISFYHFISFFFFCIFNTIMIHLKSMLHRFMKLTSAQINVFIYLYARRYSRNTW